MLVLAMEFSRNDAGGRQWRHGKAPRREGGASKGSEARSLKTEQRTSPAINWESLRGTGGYRHRSGSTTP
jgi:hypothetical protein